MATNGINDVRTSISCENIPELFLDKLTAKMHFSQFGKIKRFILRPNRLSCTVEYEQPEAAQQALERGGQYKNVSFSIYWTDLKQPSMSDNGKPGGPSLDLEVQTELEAIDFVRSPSQNLLAFYKGGEQRTAAPTGTQNRPPLAKLSIPTTSARIDTDPRIVQIRVEFEKLANSPAFTAEERYRVLEAKDRYIRLTTERTTDIRKAKNIEGTCPDMCPEKERYMREWKCMVPSYERQPGGGAQIDHAKAIKQYSRSSADQELPLPHELRSQLALARTMHFLLTHLADLCDDEESEGGGNVSDWFHYIWDRTRGIRKDITQQDLCSPTVVELVEQCTRFHIHCAARLVSEDPSVFDQKINTENMTKCLQTLKYMYTDLAQRGHRCPTEAEFRAYMVLLYLNDGNFLWELRQLPEAIIHSKEIQFALSVYFALEENNFVRFFQLVRSTSYMNACILLRYFTQVRQKALDILRKAYAVRATASFSLEYMTRILGFEDTEQAEAFFDHYGLMIDQMTGVVLFEPRQMGYYQPELPFSTSRAVRLVESKRTVSVGEAICGRPLEQWGQQLPVSQQPNDSFDESGCLKEEVLRTVFAVQKGTEEEDPFRVQKQPPKEDHEMHTMEDDKVDSMETIVQIEPLADDSNEEKVGDKAISKELNESTELQKQREKLKLEEEKRRQDKLQEERRQAIEVASKVELEKLIDLVVEEMVPEIAESALDRNNSIQRSAVKTLNELVDELLTSYVTTIAQQEQERMERLRTARARKLCVKYFHRWHHNAKSAARWRRLMRTVPPSFVNGSIRMDELPRCDQLRSFLDARFTGSKRTADEVLQDRSVLREVFLFDAFPERKLIDPFVQLECMIQQLQLQTSNRILGITEPIYWKLIVSVPVEGEEGSTGFPSFVSRWLECCAFRKDNGVENHPYFYLATKAPPSKQLMGITTQIKAEVSQGQRAICMRLLQGQSLTSEKNTEGTTACNLTDGVLFFLSDRCRMGEARSRLKNILEKCGSHQPGIAIILYCPNSVRVEGGAVSVDNFERELGLTAGLIKRWRVFLWCKGTENDTLREAVTYLANCYRAHLQFESSRYEERLEIRPLNDFLERCVGSELWFRLDKSCRQSKGYILAGQNPNAIVQLYNSAISMVQLMVSKDFKPYVQLAEEFGKLSVGSAATTKSHFLPLPEAYFPPDWNDSKRKSQLMQLLEPLELHPVPDSLLAAIDRAALAAICQGIPMNVAELRNELSAYLSSYREQLADHGAVLNILTKQLLQETILRVTLQRAKENSSNVLPNEVCYVRNDFLRHTETDWWKPQLQQIQKEAQGTSTEDSLSNTPDTLMLSPASCSTPIVQDRKRMHKELSQHNDESFVSLNSDVSNSETSFSDSIRSESFHKRPKIVNGVTYSRDIVEDAIAQGMKALARAEEILNQKQTFATELREVFNPLEKTIMEVEKSCRTIQYKHGSGYPK
uniref:Germinal-center associated nuclear protein n=1 Tax=Anopheles epiroticus TaxID=199890 RepID=A0A182P4R2_9DIPT